jgi:chemotaxis protein CheD
MASPCLAPPSLFDQKLVVGVGSLAVSSDPAVTLTTYSLGSCLGVTLYDPFLHVGGLLHAMLPDSSINTNKASQQPAMFVDTGIAALLEAVAELNVDKHRMQICVAGGAQFLDKSAYFNIGQRNYTRLLELFTARGLTIQAAAVGGLVSRTVYLKLGTGEVRLKTSGQTHETILFKC